MPRAVKKFGVTFLVWTFKGLLGLKKCVTFLFLFLKKPIFWLYKGIFFPILILIYRGLRFLNKRLLAAGEHLEDGTLRILANKYTINVAVVGIALLVVTTNIYASDVAPQGAHGEQSILSTIVDNGQDDLLLEEATQDNTPASNESVTYLGAQALSMQGAGSGDQAYSGTENGPYTNDDISGGDQTNGESPLANAVRNQPQGDSGVAPTRTQIETHIVQQGETVGTIAQMYGISIDTLLASNRIRLSLIHPGDKLRILPTNGIAYIVKRGDTLKKIATTYKSDPQRILDMNGLSNAAALAIGDEIILPDGKIPPPPRQIIISRAGSSSIPAAPARKGDRFVWPTAARRITQYYGAWEWGTRHTGVDIAGPVGTPIYAADDGVVISSGWNTGGYGNMIIVDHGSGWFTRYGHSSKLLVHAGDTVVKGQPISLMGSTGRSTGPHLHFEIMTRDVHHRINPLGYIR